jgi:hypothetical protein
MRKSEYDRPSEKTAKCFGVYVVPVQLRSVFKFNVYSMQQTVKLPWSERKLHTQIQQI